MSDHDCYRDEIIGIEVRGVYDGILIWQGVGVPFIVRSFAICAEEITKQESHG